MNDSDDIKNQTMQRVPCKYAVPPADDSQAGADLDDKAVSVLVEAGLTEALGMTKKAEATT